MSSCGLQKARAGLRRVDEGLIEHALVFDGEADDLSLGDRTLRGLVGRAQDETLTLRPSISAARRIVSSTSGGPRPSKRAVFAAGLGMEILGAASISEDRMYGTLPYISRG
jgi:hypothetical protein